MIPAPPGPPKHPPEALGSLGYSLYRAEEQLHGLYSFPLSWHSFESVANRFSKIFSIKTLSDRKWLLDTMETFVEKKNENKACSADAGGPY